MYIYIHIPFCSRICAYCDFPKCLYDKKYIVKYLDSLKQEITTRYKNEEVLSIYIGGGTPTVLSLDELKYLFRIISIFKKSTNIEFTIESNIESLDEDKIKLLINNGVNRISLGVQSFNDKNLCELKRNHKKEDIFRVIKYLKNNNFKNISIDYIYGINNNIEEIKKDITEFLKLDIPHISCYSLIIEENTMFSIEKRNYIDEDIEFKMYNYIKHILTKNNYKQYEISNYAKEGYYSKHNLNYWNNGFYYGFGLGAVSYLDNTRITNTKNLSKYLKNTYIESTIKEDINIEIANTFMLGLRKTNGINIMDFYKRFNIEITQVNNVLKLIKEEKLILTKTNLYINPKYLYLSNEIILEFI